MKLPGRVTTIKQYKAKYKHKGQNNNCHPKHLSKNCQPFKTLMTIMKLTRLRNHILDLLKSWNLLSTYLKTQLSPLNRFATFQALTFCVLRDKIE